jgi:hypothetical protein
MSLGCVSTQKWRKFSSDRTTDAPIARAMDEVTFLQPNAPPYAEQPKSTSIALPTCEMSGSGLLRSMEMRWTSYTVRPHDLMSSGINPFSYKDG